MVFSVTSPAESFLRPQPFLNKLQFADDHERQYVRRIAKLAIDNKSRIYLLTNEVDTVYGFIALSLASTISMPCVVIDYLFTSLPYRKTQYAELDHRKVSEHLLDVAVIIAREVDTRLPVNYIALQPAHDKLVNFYQMFEFKRLHLKDWMFLRI